MMRLDIYSRPDGSYLAVPEKQQIPEEAINTDWQFAQGGVEINDHEDELPQFFISNLNQQIATKGYAITSVNKRIEISHDDG